MFLLSQLAAPANGAIETWLLSAAAVASMALLVKKLFLTKTPREPEYLTKTEFHQEMKEVREKIEAGFRRLEEAVARLDERSKK
jgi:hypothetical protein